MQGAYVFQVKRSHKASTQPTEKGPFEPSALHAFEQRLEQAKQR